MSDCSTTISRRLSTRSAITPPYGPSTSTGRVCRATTKPSAVAECVRVNTSHDWATDCIHVPMSEVDWPTKNRRKFGTDRAEKVRRPIANRRLTARCRARRRGPRRHRGARPAPRAPAGRPRRRRASRSSSSARLRESTSLRSERIRSSSARPLAVASTRHTRRSASSERRRMSPAVLELGDEAGKHRRVEAGEARQVRQTDRALALGRERGRRPPSW